MFDIFGYLSFNCIPTFANLILILIFNSLSISFDSCQLTKFQNLKNFSKSVPIMSILNLILQSSSFISAILVFFIKNYKDKKIINKIIVVMGKILKIISIILALTDIVILVNEFSYLNENDFLNDSIKYVDESQNYTINIFYNLKKISDLPFIIDENNNKFIAEDLEKFKIVDTSFQKESLKEISGEDNYDDEFSSKAFSLSLMILEEILIILSGLNWGTVEKKIGKLIDGKIECREEEMSEEPNCLIKYFKFLSRIKFIIITIIFFVIEFILFVVIIIYGKPNWAQNNIFGSCMAFNLGTCFFSFFLGFPMYKASDFCVSTVFLTILLITYIGNLYTIILSFYALYHSYKGKTFFYYFCYQTDILCDGLFEGNFSEIIDLYKEKEFNYVYYKIFICPTKKSLYTFILITRIIILIWHLYRFGSCIFFIRNSGNLDKIMNKFY